MREQTVAVLTPHQHIPVKKSINIPAATAPPWKRSCGDPAGPMRHLPARRLVCARLMLLRQLPKHTASPRQTIGTSAVVDVCPLIFPLQSCFGPSSSVTDALFVGGGLLLFLFSASALTGHLRATVDSEIADLLFFF